MVDSNGNHCAPREAWQILIEGNGRWRSFNSAYPRHSSDRRSELREGQAPHVCVLACSDSRAPIETIFDQGLGDVFVIRTAGQILDSAVLASLEYAVDSLHVPLVVVLGHQSCGAVAATVAAMDSGPVPQRFQRELVAQVAPSVIEARHDGQNTTADYEKHHVLHTVIAVLDRLPTVRQRLDAGLLGLVGARYRLDDGVVEPLVFHGVD